MAEHKRVSLLAGLSIDDINTLGQALDAWVFRRATDTLLDAVTAALTNPDVNEKELAARLIEERDAAMIEKQIDRDCATLIQAKLIMIRQAMSNPVVAD